MRGAHMPHKSKYLFVSHSSKDAEMATAICDILHRAGLKTWISRRDLRTGEWDQDLAEAIVRSSGVVFLWSRNSDASSQVKKELVWAEKAKIDILPLRLEEFESGRLDFTLSPIQIFSVVGPTGRLKAKTIASAAADLIAGHGRTDVEPYMIGRGPKAFQQFTGGPHGAVDVTLGKVESARSLRNKLLRGRHKLKNPVKITINGTLFPCALLSSGWWDKHAETKNRQIKWRDELQQWLFHGFDEWGPSWDFTWDFDNKAKNRKRPYFVAQIGDGDEANSIPVLLTASKARKLRDQFREHWGGMEASATGVLGHRRHFVKHVAPGALDLFGGLLDYCLFIDDEKKDHKVEPGQDDTSIYSGYLWKCVAPKEFYRDRNLRLNDVYFIWEHVNFASDDALKYGLDAIARKEELIERRRGKLVLVQKSSSFVSGTPALSPDAVYRILTSKSE
jgi:TIR domain-containing protein